MNQYLTASHTVPPKIIVHNDHFYLVDSYLDQTDMLNKLGIFLHITQEGPAPLGYTDWELVDSAYYREPAGTQENIQAALDAQSQLDQELYLDSLSCTALQAELELIDRDLWATIQAWIDQQNPVTQAFFRRAHTWQYRDPRLQYGASELGLNDQQLIEILEAAKLK